MGGARNPKPMGKDSYKYPQLAPHPVGQRIMPIYVDRISQFTSKGQWEKQNLLSMMYDGVAKDEPHIKLSVWHAPEASRPGFKEAVSHDFEPTKVGNSFGPSWSTHWFKVQLSVPDDLVQKEHLELHWDAHCEAMVWSDDGVPLQGLTGGDDRIEWILPKSFRDGKEHIIFIELACNGMFGNGPDITIAPPDPDRTFKLSKAEIVAVNLQARRLYMDMWAIEEAAKELPRESWEQHRAVQIATDAIDAFEVGQPACLDKCRQITQQYLGRQVDSASVYESEKEAQVFAIGHCHIDTCWLWPWAETRRKVARSWTSQCNLMEQYPELRFVCSQAQQYKWLEDDYPQVFDRVHEKIIKGQFCPIGGSWVEHDTNMPSGESLVRQFLYGQQYFESRFGTRCQTFWLPDTFGYAAQLPQICRLAGMNRFLTQKLSWNNINLFPHTTFNWVALDGSQVLCHMPPSETYTSKATFNDVRRSISNHKSLDHGHNSLLVFGKGDGGGGPTWQHIEKLRRYRGLADQTGGVPRVHVGSTVDQFFELLEPKSASFPTWHGELYFEFHRGTYTTQSNNKRDNRATEQLLHDVELLATIASVQSDSDFTYPKSEIDRMWEAVLLCQFHDCLPGSSIEMCYRDSDKLYAEVFSMGKELLQDIYDAFGLSTKLTGSPENAVAINTLPWYREELVDVSEHMAGIACGTGPVLRVAPFETAGNQKVVTVRESSDCVFVLENAQLRLTVKDGCISSLVDVAQERELIAAGGMAGQYVIFDDKPLYHQAWDVEVYHLDTRKTLASTNTRISENKPHRVSLVTETRISDASSVKTTISLSAALGSQPSQVDFKAEVEWHETMKFLKVEFPVEIRNTEASYETAFGVVRRPTHFNTSWDMAKFEVCCHRFADLSEPTYGVSILNDSKYGFATCGNMMRLSLLRSPKAPDLHADMGHHTIRWALLPHSGALGAQTVRAAFAFNSRLRLLSEAAPSADKRPSPPAIRLSGDDNLVLDTVKRAEAASRGIVLRIYDALGCRGRGRVHLPWPSRRVYKTNVLEDDLHEVQLADEPGKGACFAVLLRPFEVATYRVELVDDDSGAVSAA